MRHHGRLLGAAALLALVALGACTRPLDVSGTYTGSGGGSYSVAHTGNDTMTVTQLSTGSDTLVVAVEPNDRVTLRYAGCVLRATLAGSPDRTATLEPNQPCPVPMANGAAVMVPVAGQATFSQNHVTLTLGGQYRGTPGDIGQLTRTFNGNR